MNMIKVKTESGFECEVDKERLDDWAFARAAAAASKGGGAMLDLAIYMMDCILSAEDAERLQEHIKEDDGRVPTSKIMVELTEIMNKAGEKN